MACLSIDFPAHVGVFFSLFSFSRPRKRDLKTRLDNDDDDDDDNDTIPSDREVVIATHHHPHLDDLGNETKQTETPTTTTTTPTTTERPNLCTSLRCHQVDIRRQNPFRCPAALRSYLPPRQNPQTRVDDEPRESAVGYERPVASFSPGVAHPHPPRGPRNSVRGALCTCVASCFATTTTTTLEKRRTTRITGPSPVPGRTRRDEPEKREGERRRNPSASLLLPRAFFPPTERPNDRKYPPWPP